MMLQNFILPIKPLKKRFLICTALLNGSLKYVILSLFILLSSQLYLSAQLSPNSEISILTCAPGEELYSIFGHTAIRVQDSISNQDYVFNYGTFDFNTPNFYVKFMKGELHYILSVTTFKKFIREYQYDKRSVVEQRLNLTLDEREQIISALIKNSLPENREYHYHFFYDNCATRVRDIIDLDNSHSLDFGQLSTEQAGLTYRKAIGIYLIHSKWTKFGMDLILGEPTDEVLNSSTIQFLPDFLYDQFKTAKKYDGTSIVAEEKVVLNFTEPSPSWKMSPGLFLWLLLLVIILISWREIKRGKLFKAINFTLFLSIFLLSILIIFLWFFTWHSVTEYNWNLIWANPINFLMILPRVNKSNKFIWVPWFIIICNFSMLILMLFVPQEIPLSLIPLWLILVVRSVTYIKIQRNKSHLS